LARCEARSEHPLARAIVIERKWRHLPLDECAAFALNAPAAYFAAAAAFVFASARRSVFFRRVARFFTLSLPL
jgi:hypothetical protein